MIFELTIPDNVVAEEPELRDFIAAMQLMLNRAAVSHYKYGCMVDYFPDNACAVDALDKRRAMYADTGNTENMIDAANFAVAEYLFPSHPKAHFRAQDSHESPGVQWRNESQTRRWRS